MHQMLGVLIVIGMQMDINKHMTTMLARVKGCSSKHPTYLLEQASLDKLITEYFYLLRNFFLLIIS